jgi:hypothetical protein
MSRFPYTQSRFPYTHTTPAGHAFTQGTCDRCARPTLVADHGHVLTGGMPASVTVVPRLPEALAWVAGGCTECTLADGAAP